MSRKKNPNDGVHPPTKTFDPEDPHFNPMHPPKGMPMDLLEAEWGELKAEIEWTKKD